MARTVDGPVTTVNDVCLVVLAVVVILVGVVKNVVALRREVSLVSSVVVMSGAGGLVVSDTVVAGCCEVLIGDKIVAFSVDSLWDVVTDGSVAGCVIACVVLLTVVNLWVLHAPDVSGLCGTTVVECGGVVSG